MINPDHFANALLAWYDVHGRKNLPWQREVTPYRVWVSEIMLQQTQVSTVLGYFERFMQRFPDIPSLAAAPEDEVLHLWTGLGYYSRARNLQKAAQIVMTTYDGQLPTDLDALMALPGIGRSTAGAILSLGMNRRAAILDGNVKRVLARYAALPGYPGEPRVAQRLWALAEQLTPQQRVGAYTQAMMDLGALLCTRRKPACLTCPLRTGCSAHQQDRTADFPSPRPRRELPLRHWLMPVFMKPSGEILLLRRRPTGIWGGLWCPPTLEPTESVDAYAKHLGIKSQGSTALPPVLHTFTHFRLELRPQLISVVETRPHIAETPMLWYNPGAGAALGLPTPILKLLHHLQETRT